MKINSISISDPCFPEALRNIPTPPKQLFYIGKLAETKRNVAIVGSRHLTNYGREITRELAERLASRGVGIISGLALGVDGIAQESAIRAGGYTIAVLASGLDSISPRSHRQLAINILEKGGAIVSEYEPGTPPLQFRFLQRNRLVSGLADAVIITEAGARSGTMNTVMHALQQGKDVYAIPGNITSPMSAGCNKLIEQGATPIINIEAFIDQFAPQSSTPRQHLLLAQTPEEQAIVDLIESGVRDGDVLQKRSKLDATTYSTTMTMLELRSVVRPLGGNMWSL
ncbi:DNA-protecting protein DprA [Candidatus Saccharibacteria bacterium]|nr:DNA-protecting protein DprA [Candidatus Saccharibacteria bacterium]NCU40435.1 DNA-protecting protein DprA [Candidatus Saccharibacteria bacterium]